MVASTPTRDAIMATLPTLADEMISSQIVRHGPQDLLMAIAKQDEEAALNAIDMMRIFLDELERRLVGGCSVCQEPGDKARLDSAGRCQTCQP